MTEPDYPPYWMLTVDGPAPALAVPRGRPRWTTARIFRRPTAPTAPSTPSAAPVLRAQRTFYPRATAPYVMPREASVNIDSELDFALAELLLARRAAEPRLAAR